MEQKLPKIRIRYNTMLDKVFTFYCQHNPELKQLGWNDWTPPTKEEILQHVRNYKIEWRKHEEEILDGISSCLDLDFVLPIIDVHIVSGNPRQISNPLIIKSSFPPSEFVGTLMHELIHYICAINNIEELDEYLKQPNINETHITRIHIIVLAALTHIYKDVFNDENRLAMAQAASKKHSTPEYTKAWEIVDSLGYQTILGLFRKNKKVKIKESR